MKKFINKAIWAFKKGEKGYTAMIVAATLPFIIGFISFGVDKHHSNTIKTQYSSVGIEILAEKTVNKNTLPEDIASWLESGYEQNKLSYNEIEVTNLVNDNEFRIRVRFDYKSLFASIDTNMAISTFKFKQQ